MPVLPNPSILAHTLHGGLFLLAVLVIVQNFSAVTNLRVYEQLVILLLLSAVVGIHAISHAKLESQYSYNPWRLFF